MGHIFDGLFGRFFRVLFVLDLLLIIDFLFLRGLVFAGVLDAVPLVLRLEYVFGLPSFFGYAKLMASIVFLMVAWRYCGQQGYLLLAALLTLVLVDDVFEIHEYIGVLFASDTPPDALSGQFGLRQRDFGELIAFAVMGCIGIAIMVWVVIKADTTARGEALGFTVLICVLGTFAVGVDMIQIGVKAGLEGSVKNVVHLISQVFEEGGEMISLSLICAYSHLVLQRRKNRKQPMTARQA